MSSLVSFLREMRTEVMMLKNTSFLEASAMRRWKTTSSSMKRAGLPTTLRIRSRSSRSAATSSSSARMEASSAVLTSMSFRASISCSQPVVAVPMWVVAAKASAGSGGSRTAERPTLNCFASSVSLGSRCPGSKLPRRISRWMLLATFSKKRSFLSGLNILAIDRHLRLSRGRERCDGTPRQTGRGGYRPPDPRCR